MTPYSTPQNLPFLFYKLDDTGNLDFQAMKFPARKGITEVPADWYQTVDLSPMHNARSDPNFKIFAANIIANRVALRTVRAVANILFVPDFDSKIYFDNAFATYSKYDTVIIDRSLQPNEIRCTYWKIVDGRAVDGGVQFSPDGYTTAPNSPSYFARCFL